MTRTEKQHVCDVRLVLADADFFEVFEYKMNS